MHVLINFYKHDEYKIIINKFNFRINNYIEFQYGGGILASFTLAKNAPGPTTPRAPFFECTRSTMRIIFQLSLVKLGYTILGRKMNE